VKAQDVADRFPSRFAFSELALSDADDVPDQLKFYAENRMHVMRLRAKVVYF
jgi:hypothetical protein